jgi:hypothetical protein
MDAYNEALPDDHAEDRYRLVLHSFRCDQRAPPRHPRPVQSSSSSEALRRAHHTFYVLPWQTKSPRCLFVGDVLPDAVDDPSSRRCGNASSFTNDPTINVDKVDSWNLVALETGNLAESGVEVVTHAYNPTRMFGNVMLQVLNRCPARRLVMCHLADAFPPAGASSEGEGNNSHQASSSL